MVVPQLTSPLVLSSFPQMADSLLFLSVQTRTMRSTTRKNTSTTWNKCTVKLWLEPHLSKLTSRTRPKKRCFFCFLISFPGTWNRPLPFRVTFCLNFPDWSESLFLVGHDYIFDRILWCASERNCCATSTTCTTPTAATKRPRSTPRTTTRPFWRTWNRSTVSAITRGSTTAKYIRRVHQPATGFQNGSVAALTGPRSFHFEKWRPLTLSFALGLRNIQLQVVEPGACFKKPSKKRNSYLGIPTSKFGGWFEYYFRGLIGVQSNNLK